jgi:hypothetical protein
VIIGLCVAAICLPYCVICWWMRAANVVPSSLETVNTQGLFICFASAYLPLIPGVFYSVCHRRGVCTRATIRLLCGFLVGASLGLFMSGMFAIFDENPELRNFDFQQFQSSLFAKNPEAALGSALPLFQRAQVLAMQLAFLDSCVYLAVLFGVAAVLAILLYDKVMFLLSPKQISEA